MISDETKERLIEELAKTPFVSIACKRAGISRASFYRFLEEDGSFKKKCRRAHRDGRSLINDMAESTIVRGIQKGDMGATKYWLGHNHKRYMKQEPAKESEGYVRGLLDALKENIAKRTRDQRP